MGESNLPAKKVNEEKISSNLGTIYSIWENEEPLTANGHLAYFSQYLHTGNIFSELVADCPLEYSSNNAPQKKDIVGTAVLSILSGHSRYSHCSSLYGDQVAAELLGINKIVSSDSLARGLKKIDKEASDKWLKKNLLKCCEQLLTESYVLDIDPTVKPIYGKQEGGEIAYNPKKPGRPSQVYHTYIVGNLRLILNVDVLPGKQTAGKYSHPGLWELLETLPERCRPSLIRGDIGYGNEATMIGCETRNQNYLFKLKQTPKAKELIQTVERPTTKWENAGKGWEGTKQQLQLTGWSKARTVFVLRCPKEKNNNQQNMLMEKNENDGFLFPEVIDDYPGYEYQILVTNLNASILTVAQLYRDRGDCENVFDEMKNQWGWCGYTTEDIKRTQIMARLIALVYNWWNIFSRLAEGDKHLEAKTSRPMLQSVIGRISRKGNKTRIHLSVTGSLSKKIIAIYTRISTFLNSLNSTAKQLSNDQKWMLILEYAFRKYLQNKPMKQLNEGSQLLLGL